jgi:hypothetical protein
VKDATSVIDVRVSNATVGATLVATYFTTTSTPTVNVETEKNLWNEYKTQSDANNSINAPKQRIL